MDGGACRQQSGEEKPPGSPSEVTNPDINRQQALTRTPNSSNFQSRNGEEERKSGRADEEFHGFPALLGIIRSFG
jgi:hypothetical protein